MMTINLLSILFLLPTLLFLLVNLPFKAFQHFQNTLNIVRSAVYLSLIGAGVSIFWISTQGATELSLFSIHDLGLSIRIDPLSTIMYTMISIIGYVVVRFSKNYLDGDSRIQQFYGHLAFTLAFVQLLVISGNLATLFIAWVGTSVGLHQLLRFYPNRQKALIAARKKFIIARLADLTLFSAFSLIYIEFGSGSLSYLFEQFQLISAENISFNLQLAALLLVFSAALKSVQLPFHGWLLDVMEAPTPVSALLHAGLLNAGPFLIIRFAFLIDLSVVASITLISIGAISALFGAIASTTQPSIKSALAYSSIGHMGFTLLVSGFGVYAASLLHLVAHSFYKAHAFLSSGSVIEKVQTKYAANFIRKGNPLLMVLGSVGAIALFGLFAYLWGINPQTEIQLLAIAGVIFLGVITVQVNALDANINVRSLILLVLGSGLVINAFFFLEKLTHSALYSQIPGIREATSGLLAIIATVLILFAVTVMIQLYAVKFRQHRLAKTIGVHFKNGLYFNVLFDRMVNSLVVKTERSTH